MERILRRCLSVNATTDEEILQRRTKGFYRREEDTAIADCIAFNIVEEAIGVCLQIVIQTVTAQSAQQRHILGLLFWYISNVHARSIALVLDVETKLLFLNIR